MIEHLHQLDDCEPDTYNGVPLNACPWQIRLLELNPSYTGWRPGADSMPGSFERHGWCAAITHTSWSEFVLGIDTHNVCVDFYFSVGRDVVDCDACDATGYADGQSREAYDEAALCKTCNGHQSVPSEDRAHVSLTLWVLHPRKGASRGVMIERIHDEAEAMEALVWLREAAEQNAKRWEPIVAEIPKANGLPERWRKAAPGPADDLETATAVAFAEAANVAAVFNSAKEQMSQLGERMRAMGEMMATAPTITHCQICARPAHASETNDAGNHPVCEAARATFVQSVREFDRPCLVCGVIVTRALIGLGGTCERCASGS